MDLARRVVLELCRRGGWRAREGKRWWDRHPPGVLRFGDGGEGDAVLAYVALDDGQEVPGARGLALAWLGFADRLLDEGPPPDLLDWDGLVRGTGAAIVDALADELRGRWARMRRGGVVLDAFLDAAERAGARVLAARVALEAPAARARLARWRDEARAVRFIDDGYDEAQRLLAALEGGS